MNAQFFRFLCLLRANGAWPWLSALLLSVLVPLTAQAQLTPTATYPYVLEQTPRTPQATVTRTSSYTDVPATIEYVDGLGRPRQTIQVLGAGNAGLDVATTFTEYDPFGRPMQVYKSMPGLNQGGSAWGGFQYDPYGSATGFYKDAYPFNQTYYESSPLDRPAKTIGAGVAWRPGDNGVKTSYGVATANTVIRFKADLVANKLYAYPASGAGSVEYYRVNDISRRVITDEQYNQLIEYTDLQGRLIRRDVLTGAPQNQTLTTAYVYDSYERLAAVIPPKLYDYLVTNALTTDFLFFTDAGFTTPNPVFKDNGYAYQYDARGRLIRKHVASAGWTFLVYDKQDRLVMSQDEQDRPAGNPQNSTYWRYTKYDSQNRVVSTGRTVLTTDAATLRTAFAGQSGNAFPAVVPNNATDVLTQNVYDSYTGNPLPYLTSNPLPLGTPFPSAAAPNATGLLTYSYRRDLVTTTSNYASAYWYDDKGRIVQSRSQNHLGGVDRTDNQFRFNGELLKTVLTHSLGSGVPLSPITKTFTYDHWGRPLGITHAIGTNSPVRLASYAYDGIGRLIQKQLQPPSVAGARLAATSQSISRLGSKGLVLPTEDVAPAYIDLKPDGHYVDVSAPSAVATGYQARLAATAGALQVLDYSYNVRGWLRGINAADSINPYANGRGDVFYLVLDYNQINGTFNRYDGSIGRMRWGGNRDYFYGRVYAYGYDGAGRLSGSEYTGNTGEDYKVSNLTYDRNGNLLTLRRGVSGGIDALTYSYSSGNSLLSVTDASPNTAGFSDGNKTGNDYTYWPDGSLRSDLNRGITQIQYNHLKLPSQLSFSSGKVVSIRYDARGGTKADLGRWRAGSGVPDISSAGAGFITPRSPARLCPAHQWSGKTPASAVAADRGGRWGI
ncbi:DUF6443 domain-containing protein [Spirosoma aerophilum]